MTMSFAKHILNTVFLGFPPLTKKNKKETEYEDFFCFDHIIRALYEEKKTDFMSLGWLFDYFY